METTSISPYNTLKRYWRRRRYQRLDNSKKRKLRVIRLGGAKVRRAWKLRTIPRFHLKIVSQIKLLAKLHDAYVDLMIRLTNNMGKLNNKSLFKERKVAKDREISMVSCGEEVDSRLLLEIYKRLAASREFRDF